MLTMYYFFYGFFPKIPDIKYMRKISLPAEPKWSQSANLLEAGRFVFDLSDGTILETPSYIINF